MAIRILGTGSFLPPKVVTNDDLAKTLDTSDEWIFSHTGIHSRHIAGADESTSTLAIAAGKAAIESAGVNPEDIGLVIVATCSPDFNVVPSVACIVQDALGCKNAGAYDLLAACTGFVYALEQARCWVMAHPGAKALVIGAETLSRIVDWKDRGTCILFGDGAGAVVIGDEVDGASSKAYLYSDGSGWADIVREGGSRKIPADAPVPHSTLLMQGHAVFNFAVRTVTSTINQVAEAIGIKPNDFDLIFAHQANWRILESVSRRVKVPMEKFFITIHDTGNTSGASIPIALDRAVKEGKLKDGMKICLVGFGAGHTWGGTAMTWPLV